MSKSKSTDLASNKKAYHDYEILETFVAGVSLVGTEIKSLRDGGGSLGEAYVRIIKGEPFLVGAHIAHYKFGNVHNHTERRDRKLLLQKREIQALKKAISEKGLTIVPLNLHLSNKGYCKAKIGIARGKKLHDKRSSIKEKEQKRTVQREMKNS
ncbi:MAG: SsrA-binding protein [Chlamydiia bacterium]|nr:SsrA-binding protein [Chlamydiia bacterium]